eukprot:CAMPEP_0175000762 /NCGR_PEP_ID=MMETSP0005-20121125/2769_1 /TAXON_ID=420556 /ORGANISM="Ochromonas sp., Strain CCMP1393" /LENGTH=447 /DNA_ID=CAMNT_0016255595 /DNA_START=706 /DNA_END=2048 /DNA_ORIENTATION=+
MREKLHLTNLQCASDFRYTHTHAKSAAKECHAHAGDQRREGAEGRAPVDDSSSGRPVVSGVLEAPRTPSHSPAPSTIIDHAPDDTPTTSPTSAATETMRALLHHLQLSEAHVEPGACRYTAFGAAGVVEEGSTTAVQAQSASHLQHCAQLLGLQEHVLTTMLNSQPLRIDGGSGGSGSGGTAEVIQKVLAPAQCAGVRDALARAIYARLFQWLVDMTNDRFTTNTAVAPAAAAAAGIHGGISGSSISECTATISLLDIFGFEVFEHNHFEQLMINFANEKLQQKFTLDVIKSVQEEYAEEGIVWQPIPFLDNLPVLRLIESTKTGLMAQLNEECILPGGSDVRFLAKLGMCTSSSPFEPELRSATNFSIRHYAGVVSYSVEGFLQKNNDRMQEHLTQQMSASTNSILQAIFSSPQPSPPPTTCETPSPTVSAFAQGGVSSSISSNRK